MRLLVGSFMVMVGVDHPVVANGDQKTGASSRGSKQNVDDDVDQKSQKTELNYFGLDQALDEQLRAHVKAVTTQKTEQQFLQEFGGLTRYSYIFLYSKL
jgi:hypothetical protein